MTEFDMWISRKIGEPGSERGTGTDMIMGIKGQMFTKVGDGKAALPDMIIERKNESPTVGNGKADQ